LPSAIGPNLAGIFAEFVQLRLLVTSSSIYHEFLQSIFARCLDAGAQLRFLAKTCEVPTARSLAFVFR
jgi:hypothetical protein